MRTQNRPFRLTASAAIAAWCLRRCCRSLSLAQGAPPPPPQPVCGPSRAAIRPRVSAGSRSSAARCRSMRRTTSSGTPATLNYPVTQGDAFWTEPNAQAVIEVSASRIAMAPGTELDVATLTDTAFQATAAAGRAVSAHPGGGAGRDLRGADAARAGHACRTGPLWGDGRRHPEPDTVTVIEGSAHVSGPGRVARCRPPIRRRASPAPTRSRARWVRRSATRSSPRCWTASGRRSRRGSRRPPVVAAMPGGDDLSAYGHWSTGAGIRRGLVSAGGAGLGAVSRGQLGLCGALGLDLGGQRALGLRAVPLRPLGAYRRPLGLGARAAGPAAPVYAPALVTFLGVGVGVAVGVGIGAALAAGTVGWCPLGPREPYHPWYRASDRYFQSVNRRARHQHHDDQPQRHDQQLRQPQCDDRGAGERDDRVAAGARHCAAGRSGAACAGAAGHRHSSRCGRRPTTGGVTPAVARQLNLPPPRRATSVAPGR